MVIYKREQEQLLIQGCKIMAKDNLTLTKEFEAIEDFNNWAW